MLATVLLVAGFEASSTTDKETEKLLNYFYVDWLAMAVNKEFNGTVKMHWFNNIDFYKKWAAFCIMNSNINNSLSAKTITLYYSTFIHCTNPDFLIGNLVPRVFSLPRESTLVTDGHVSARLKLKLKFVEDPPSVRL